MIAYYPFYFGPAPFTPRTTCPGIAGWQSSWARSELGRPQPAPAPCAAAQPASGTREETFWMFTIRNIVRGARTIFTSPTGGELISSTAQLMPCLNSLQPGYEMCPGRSWGKKTHLQAGERPVGEVVQLWVSTAGFSRQRNTEDQGNGFLWGSEDIHRAHNKGSCLQLGSGGRASNPCR